MSDEGRLWYRGELREPFMGCEPGDVVFVKRTLINHTSPGIGPTYWVYIRDRKKFYQVSENAYGRKVGILVKYVRECVPSMQKKLDDEGTKFLEKSAYSKKNLPRLTFFLNERNRDTK